jgi:hypothetical protein
LVAGGFYHLGSFFPCIPATKELLFKMASSSKSGIPGSLAASQPAIKLECFNY